ncbi:putative abhydrolase domain containing 11, partial [Operophtera brumata]
MKAFDFRKHNKTSKAKIKVKKQLKKFIANDFTMKEILSNIDVKSDGTIGWICNLDILIKHFKYIASFPSSMLDKKYKGPAMFIGGQVSDFIPRSSLTSRTRATTFTLKTPSPSSNLPSRFLRPTTESIVLLESHGMDILLVSKQSLLKCMCQFTRITRRSAVDLAHKVHGPPVTDANTPIIVLHGVLGSKKNWQSMSKMLSSATKKTVVTADARNHGESPHDDSHSYQDLASDVSLLMSKLTISKAHVIGHSMGGRTAMVLALTESAKVASMVVVDISPISTVGLLNDFFPRLLELMKTIDFTGLDLGKGRTLAKAKIMASGLIQHEALMHFIIMNIGKRRDDTIGWMCNVDVLRSHFDMIAKFPDMSGQTYDGPVMFIGGDQSNYI